MKIRKSIVALLPALVLLLPSCQETELDYVRPEKQGNVYANVPAPVNCDPETKGISIDADNKAVFKWIKDVDNINVFSSKKGESMIYSIKEVSSENPTHCSFLVEDFALKTGNTYYGFYPSTNSNDPSKVIIDYTTQRQYALDDDSHLSAYSYMVSAPVEATESGAGFAFSHKSGWITFKILAKDDFTAEKIVVSTTTPEAFIVKGTMDVVSQDITVTKAVSSVVLYLGEPEEGLEIKGGIPTRAFMALNDVVELSDVKAVLSGHDKNGNAVEVVKEITGTRFYKNGSAGSITLQQEGAVAKQAKIGDTYYETLAEAVTAAEAGNTVEILVAGTYKIPNLPKNITIKGDVAGVVFDCVGSGSIASVPNGASFEEVTMYFGQGGTNYHGFQHAGTINMKGCTLNGLFFSYGDMNFDGCTFNQESTDYNMWCYSGNVTYTGCTVNCNGKFVNVYNEGNDGGTPWEIKAEGCTFNSTKVNKAAFNVKETCGAKMLKYNVVISNCTANENFPAATEFDETNTLWVIDPLVQVDDRNLSATESGITVTLDGNKVYPVAKADLTINSVEELLAFAEAVNGGNTMAGKLVQLAADIDLQGVDWKPIGNVTSYPGVTFAGTFDGCNHTISNMTTSDYLPNHATAGFFGSIMGTVKNLTLESVAITSTHYAGAIAGYTSANNDCVIENCHVIGGAITSTTELVDGSYDNGDKVGGIIGYIVGGVTVKGCSVNGVTITAYRDLGGIVGSADNATALVTDNTVENSVIIQDNTNGYKTSVSTYGAIIGRTGGAVIDSSNTATNVEVKSVN
ncbi:MAG: hypothetical protein MJY91_07685 [Bacteroidales bacterium]|nr:hypothetical protein [Bacteroidales bacterium]